MDVERTMEFILDRQAQAEVRMDKLEKQVKATADLLRGAIKLGARQLRDVRESQRANDQTMRALAEAQKHTDLKVAELAQTVDTFIQGMRNGKNSN